MISLIDFYDNALIYYPNIFFPVIIIVGISVLVNIIRFIFLLSKKVKNAFKKITNEFGQIKRIKSRKIHIIESSPTMTIVNFMKFVVKIVKIILTFVNNFFKYFEQLILKLARRIGREILID